MLRQQQCIRVGVWCNSSDLSRANRLFRADGDADDGLHRSFALLREIGTEQGFEINALDAFDDLDAIDLLIFVDFPDRNHPQVRRAFDSGKPRWLLIQASPVTHPDNGPVVNHALFDRVYTWDDRLIDGKRYFKVRYAGDIDPQFDPTAVPPNELCMVADYTVSDHAHTLFKQQSEAAAWFAAHAPESFDLYGAGWDAAGLSCHQEYAGAVTRILQNYRYSLCYEDAADFDGYLTQRLFDTLRAGSIPIYRGASNIADYLPADCFIDLRDFPSFEALHERLRGITEEEVRGYRLRIADYLVSGPAFQFRSEFFAWGMLGDIARFILGRRGTRPKMSVLIPTFDHGRYLPQAIDTALAQKVEGGLEVVVLDNASTDDTSEVVSRYAHEPRVRYQRNDRNIFASNWNRVLQLGLGEYCAVLSADDYYGERHLETVLAELDRHPECCLAYRPCRWVDENGAEIRAPVHPGHRRDAYAGGRNEAADLLIYDCYITPSAAVFRRDAIDRVGLFDLRLKGACDWELWVRLGLEYQNFVFLPEPQVFYRVHGAQSAKEINASLHPLLDHLLMVEKVLASPHADRLRGHWDAILQHLERRRAGYPMEQTGHLEARFAAVRDRIKVMQRDEEGASGSGLVSVIVATKDRPNLLRDALASLVDQEYPHWEAIVVNDGGVSVEAIAREADHQGRIHYLALSRNVGQVRARNIGLRLAQGEYICFLDDDDIFLPDHLTTVVQALKTGLSPMVYTDSVLVAERIVDGSREIVSREAYYRHQSFSLERLLVENYIPINTWALRRDCLDDVGVFDERLQCLEDWELLIRLAKRYSIRHIARETVEVHARLDQVDNVSRHKRSTYLETFQAIYQRHTDGGDAQIRARREGLLEALRNEQSSAHLPVALAETERKSTYETWIEVHGLTESDGQIMAERMFHSWRAHPSIHLLMIVQPGDEPRLAQTIQSISSQLYRGWGLSVFASSPAQDEAFADLPMLEWRHVKDDFGAEIAAAIAETAADWVAWLEPGDLLEPHALLRFGDYISRHPEWLLIYPDCDVLDESGNRTDPRFKPDFNLDLLRSHPYMGAFAMFRRDLVEAAGGFQWLAEIGVYDLAFRAYEHAGAGAVGHVPDVLYHRHRENIQRYDQGRLEEQAREVLKSHLQRLAVEAEIRPGYLPMSFFVEYRHETYSRVTIIVPTRDQPQYLIPCVESLLEKTDYPDFELILVDNETVDPIALEFLKDIEGRDSRVSVLRYPHPFNFSAMINLAAQKAQGEYLLLLNNDTAIIQENWLQRLMDHAQRPEVGVVGARLVLPDQRVQHAGMIVGMGDSAHHVGAGRALNEPGYMGRAQLVQNFTAVTGACLLTRKALFDSLGGLDEDRFGVFFNDVDYCLKVGEQGKLVVWTPFVTLVHHALDSALKEDPTMALPRKSKEVVEFARAWVDRMPEDRAYNRNLSLNAIDWRPEIEVVGKWDPHFHDRPRLLAAPIDASGSPRYRVLCPLLALEREALTQIGILPEEKRGRIPSVWEMARLAPDTLLAQMFIHDHQIEALSRYKQVLPELFRVFAIDDLVTDVPEWSPFRKRVYPDIERRLRAALRLSDRLIVSTEPLVEAYGDFVDDVRVVPNYLERRVWGELTSRRRRSDKPRVGWAGAQQHQGDLELLLEVVKATADEVDWVFMGMWLKEFEPYVKEFCKPVPFEKYPAQLATLDLDLAVAPLAQHPFNEAKSNLRLLEYGALGWPVVCSDIEPYRGAPVCRVANTPAAWIEAVRERVHDWDAMAEEGDRLRAWVHENWMLEDHLDEWLDALLSSPPAVRRAAAQG